jgi:UDP-glucose 6-dehydrogenase
MEVAIIGAGFIGPVHAEALRRVGVQIAGILGVDDAESKRAAEALGIPKAYRNLEEVLEIRVSRLSISPHPTASITKWRVQHWRRVSTYCAKSHWR